MRDDLSAFVERMKRDRIAAGLPATIADADTLRVVASLVAKAVPHASAA